MCDGMSANTNQVSIVASYIKERTKNAQFIVISLRNNMFELAARLVGVYKVNHMTKSVTIENRDYIREGKARPPGGGKVEGVKDGDGEKEEEKRPGTAGSGESQEMAIR